MRAIKPTTLLLALLFSLPALCQDIRTTLPDGKKVVLHADKTWEYDEGITYNFDFSKLRDNEIPSFLRAAITADRATLVTVVEMHLQGWRYTMPAPKSAQAAWGNGDGRTTWWSGWWHNEETGKYSRRTPEKAANGYYYGDEQDNHGTWTNGGSPRTPTKIEWLLSDGGGVKPR